MMTNLHKRILILSSLLMVVAILAPSVIKLGHTLYEHNQEKHCVAFGTNHIHDGNLDCDFNDFTLANKVLFNITFTYTPVDIPEIKYETINYSFFYEPREAAFQALRAPPSVS